MEQADLIWHNGELVAWEDAKVHVLTHALHYGTGVFEGVRAYDTQHGTAIFRHREHIERLFRSAELYYMPIPYEREQIRAATHELIKANGFRSCYIRPIVYRGYGTMGLFPLEAPVEVTIAAWPWGAYLGEQSKATGVRAKISSWRKISAESLIPAAKATGQYLNSVLAKVEVHKAGYDEAILLDERGFVAECSGENLFIVRDGQISTPPLSAGNLDGISRRTVIELAADLGLTVSVRDFDRAELCLADEVFMTGTAAELVPVREVDDHQIGDGSRGPRTAQLQKAFEDALFGRDERRLQWLDLVAAPAAATS